MSAKNNSNEVNGFNNPQININSVGDSYEFTGSVEENLAVAQEIMKYGDNTMQKVGSSYIENYKKILMSVDKRVSLTVRPRTYNVDDSSLMKRVKDILKTKIGNDLLFHVCEESFGIIFPYTPQISGLGKTVTYESVDIPHSNLKFNQYKNTSSNDISLKAKFTADTLNNGLQMLSAVWFLNACSMSKFGKSEGNDAGLPPPILYLSGYNKMIDNIPVVITKFDYSLDDKLHYVKLDVQNKENLTYWVPTELDITINLKVQPNLRKVYNQWSLNKYKSGELFLNNMKSRNPGGEYIPSGWTW